MNKTVHMRKYSKEALSFAAAMMSFLVFAALAAQGGSESGDSSGDAFFRKSGETVLDRIPDVRILKGDARTAYRDPAGREVWTP